MQGTVYNAPAMAKRKKPRFTKLHEFLLFVVAPVILMGVVEVMWHPPVWAFFLIGIPCVAALVDLVWPLVPRRPSCAPHLLHTLLVSAVVVLYVVLAWNAQTLQNAKRLKLEKADVSAKLRFLLPQTRGSDAVNTAFKVVNDSDRVLFAEPLECDDVVARFRYVTINAPTVSYLDRPTTRVEKGGDVQSTTCLRPITFAIAMPDYSLSCVDVRVRLNYYLDDDPASKQTKIKRFWGAPLSNGFGWEEIPLNAPGSPCKQD
jgi:hypothetical protein